MSEIDKKISECDEKIQKIDAEISRLNEKRRELKNLKEKLIDKKFYEKTTELTKNNWAAETFPWSQTVREKLKSIFGCSSFRSRQLETINVVLSKHDCILVSPTGGGKSICFQLPAVCSNGITLVVSPLVALMEDQIYGLKKRNINAEMISQSTDKTTVNAIHKLLADSSFSCPLKLLYVTPERLANSKRLMSNLQKCHQFKKLDLIAIDEVHCCSTWGHDFRPDYKFLGSMKMLFPQVPILGVTATASTRVLTDVQKILNIRECLTFNAPFNRPNLFYHVLEKPGDKEGVFELLAKLLKERFAGKSGIIYTFSIKDTEEITSELLQRDVKVRPYHANLESSVRSNVHTKWITGEIQAVVATVAFGMGIDKPDVRFVIHHTLSKSMENFYQESGRAGRDGEYAECILLYRFGDIFKTTTMTFTEHNGLKNAYSMIDYCINGKKCRRDLIARYFREVWSDNSCRKMCDHCYYKDSVNSPQLDITNYYKALCRIIEKAEKLDIKLTGLKLIDAWFHKGVAKLRLEDAAPPGIDRYYGEQILVYLLINEYLREDFHYTAYQTISYIVRGGRRPSEELKFAGARILKLPPIDRLQNNVEKPEPKKEKSTPSPKKVWRKRRISSSDDEGESSKSSNSNQNKSVRSSRSDSLLTSDSEKSSIQNTSSINIEEIINQKVESQLKKYFEEKIPKMEPVEVSPKKEPIDVITKKEPIDAENDDCVLLSPPKQQVIEIIDID